MNTWGDIRKDCTSRWMFPMLLPMKSVTGFGCYWVSKADYNLFYRENCADMAISEDDF